ncbi:MAG: HAD-IA family hydrolase [Acidaminococcaceae bacterium]|nr:HAD-IA family hydrolase [Acidaminococcaceae bacterium]
MPYMDGGIVSFKAGMTKPDPRMFRLFLDQYALSPESCIFIDDTAENVKAARELGFAGIVFTSYEAFLTELKELGVSL